MVCVACGGVLFFVVLLFILRLCCLFAVLLGYWLLFAVFFSYGVAFVWLFCLSAVYCCWFGDGFNSVDRFVCFGCGCIRLYRFVCLLLAELWCLLDVWLVFGCVGGRMIVL